MNVLVYSGPGATAESVKCCTETLRQLLSPNYCVLNVTASALCNEPWANTTALLALPGGADLPYCRDLNGKGTDAIQRYIRRGGRYVGFCAGGYYASSRVEFEAGTSIEVSGPRELKFFPGTARGSAFKGFVYGRDDGVIAAPLRTESGTFKSYFNGGPCFVDAHKYDSVQVLAEYDTQIDVEGGNAAAVLCKYGSGNALLTGFHPEFNRATLLGAKKVWQELEPYEEQCIGFLRAAFQKMGLNPTDGKAIPRITKLSLSSKRPEILPYLVGSLRGEGLTNGKLVCTNDTFELHNAGDTYDLDDDTKHIDVYYTGAPDVRQTPYFNHELYYQQLAQEQEYQKGEIGTTILYGEVVTSTSTMLEKNHSLLRHLPHGFAAVGTIQVQGRGRGNNAWVNPTGVLASSTVLKVPVPGFPLAFVQYLVSLAMVEAIKGYGPGYEDMPVRLKWPNDIYALNPSQQGIDVGQPSQQKYLKIGGLLVNTTIVDNQYVLVAGLGVNTSNPTPNTSLNLILDALNINREASDKPKLEHYKLEVLLAKYMARLERMFTTFAYTGFREFESLYYERWLHSDQLVTIEQNNTKARVKGISEQGFLLAREIIDGQERGPMIELQPDGNSFDMFRGLLKLKK